MRPVCLKDNYSDSWQVAKVTQNKVYTFSRNPIKLKLELKFHLKLQA
jgi:hypothetical protein